MPSPPDLEPVMSITTNSRWSRIEQRSASAFWLAGLLILASLVVPVGLESRTEASWAVGLILVGLAVLATSIGLFGLYPSVHDRGRRLATVGATGAAIAAVAALGLLGLVGIALVGDPLLGLSIVEPMGAFVTIALSMAGGFSIGLLAFGAATLKTETALRTVGGLLAAGGAALLVPVSIEVVGVGVGIETPAWLLFPVVAFLALDALAIGYRLRSRGPDRAD